LILDIYWKLTIEMASILSRSGVESLHKVHEVRSAVTMYLPFRLVLGQHITYKPFCTALNFYFNEEGGYIIKKTKKSNTY
jgi:hypothetical protein